MPAKAFSVCALAVLALSALTTPLSAQDGSKPKPPGHPGDWSHHHIVFSDPGTYEQAVKNGTVDKWMKITKDPRYKIQQAARSAASAVAASPEIGVSAPSSAHGKETIKKDWSTTLSGVAASKTGTVGTLSSSTVSSSSTLTVDGVTFDASAPTAATATGTFAAAPTSATSPTITVQSGSQPAITLTTNATVKAATGTITAGSPGAPFTGKTIVIPSNAGGITLTPGGNPATMTGSVTAAFTTGTITLTYNNGGGTANTLSLTPSAATQGNVVGTFAVSGTSTGQFTPGTTAGTFVVTSGANTATLTPNGYQYFTISSTPHNGDTVTINSVIYTFDTSAPGSTARSVFTGSTAAQAAQNLAAAVMADSTMCATSSCFGSSTVQFANISASYDTSDHAYIFYSGISPSSIVISDNSSTRISESSGTITKGSNSCSGTAPTFTVGFGAVATTSAGTSSSAANMAAALNLSGCSTFGMTATSTATTVTVTNTAYGTTPVVSTTETLGNFSSVATQGTGASGCSNSSTGVFPAYPGITTAAEASNISTAISACNTSFSAVGASSVYTSGTTFTVTAAAPGSAITLGGSVPTGFSWSASTLGNDTGAGTCTSGTSGTFVNSGVANTLASNIYSTLISTSCTGSPGNSGVTATYPGTNTFVVTANVLGSSPAFTTTGSTATIITWGSTTGGSNGANTCTGSGPWNATFATSTTLSTIEAGITSAIVACTPVTTSDLTATGAAVVSTTVPGSGTTLTLGATNNTGIFTWSAVTPGTDGTTSGTSTPPTFAYWSGTTYLSSANVATNIATAINANVTLQSVTSGVSATNSSANVVITANATGTGGNSIGFSVSGFSAFTGAATLTGGGSGTLARVQPNAYPAKYSFDTSTASCADFVVYPTGMAGATTASTIIAYTNIYSGCSGAVPSVYWSYNTGAGYAVTTSPVMSLDGTQIAFIQSNGTAAALVLLTFAPNPSAAVSAPGAATSVTPANYNNCTAPCYTAIAFSGNTNDTFSAPFYDYHGDALYVGDDSGNLHQFTGVFSGTPAENTTSPWPKNLSATQKLSSPVYDGQWNAVFVGDFGGVLHCMTFSSGTCQGGTATAALGGAIADAPLINSDANYVVAFVSNDTVYGFSEQYFPGGQGGPVAVGTGGAVDYLYAGTFDNAYYQSSNGTGNIYVVGNTGVAGGATLYQLPLTGGFLNGTAASVVTGLNTGALPWPSPVSEFCNGACTLQTASGCTVSTSLATVTCTTVTPSFTTALDVGASIIGTDIPVGATITTVNSTTKVTISANGTGATTTGTATIGTTTSGTDYLFFSVNRGNVSGCTTTAGNGCILSYNVSSPHSSSIVEVGSGLNVTTPVTNGCWATGGLIIDSTATTPTGASQIYFVNLAGANAGNPSGLTSSGCTTVSGATIIDAVQAAQSSP